MKRMKTIGGILMAIAFCLASGVDENPVQGIYALVLMGAAWAAFRADRRAARSEERKMKSKNNKMAA